MNKKTVIVTGASTGIGKSVALTYAKKHYHVFLLARSEDKLQLVQQQIANLDEISTIVTVDLSSIDSINQAIHAIQEKVNHVDVLVNIAGVWHGKDSVYAEKNLETFSQDVILDTYFVGIISPTLLAHACIPLMTKGSKIINLSGTFENGAKGWLPYYVSKRAIEDLTVGLSQELSEKGIQVNCISPSDTATEAYAKFFPQYINEAIQPDEIAKMFLTLSDPQDMTTGKVFVMKKDQQPTEMFHA